MNSIAHIVGVIILGMVLSACEEGRQLPPRSDNTLLDCPTDIKNCPDGSVVSRDPTQNCQFASCPEPACGNENGCMPDFSAVK